MGRARLFECTVLDIGKERLQGYWGYSSGLVSKTQSKPLEKENKAILGPNDAHKQKDEQLVKGSPSKVISDPQSNRLDEQLMNNLKAQARVLYYIVVLGDGRTLAEPNTNWTTVTVVPSTRRRAYPHEPVCWGWLLVCQLSPLVSITVMQI